MLKRLSISAAATLACMATAAQVKEYTVPFPKPIGHGTDTVKVIVIGDVMMHSRQLDYNCRTFLEGISPALRQADIAIANMEFSLGGPPYSGYPAFSAPDEYAEYIKEGCGVDVFLTANNHILDKGRKGLARTLSIYDKIRVKHTGAASDSTALNDNYPLMITKRGIRLAVINFTYGTNNPVGNKSGWPTGNMMHKDNVRAAIKKAKDRRADFIIVIPHWGTEYSLSPDKRQEEWASWLATEGADVIIGAHPHVVQDSTHINGIPVIYSLGNAISNMSARNTRLGLAVELTFTHNPASAEKEMFEPKLRFLWCTLPGTLTEGYKTIFCDEWTGRREEWINPADYDNMLVTLSRVREETGIE